MPRLIGYMLLHVSRLDRLLSARLRAQMMTPMLIIALEEDASSFISLMQEKGDKLLPGSKDFKKKTVEEQIAEMLELFPMLGPYETYIKNYLTNMKEQVSS